MKRQLGLLEMVRRRTERASRRATRGALGCWAWSNAGTAGSGDPGRARRGRETRTERAKRGRRGSTLLIVMALLGMLMLLGMLYFTFASQEQANATYFAEAAKHIDDPGDDIDAIFDAALRQLIQGANYDEKNSALWGGRHSLIFNMLGHDLQPFNGTGVNVYRIPVGTTSGLPPGQLVVDQSRIGDLSGDQSLLELNDSPAARTDLSERSIQSLPAPDVDYTAADHNNAFLAYLGTSWNLSTASPTAYPVIKPSFHRPEFLRDKSGDPISDWETLSGGAGVPSSTRGRLFRPHPDHLYVPRSGQNITTPIRRFLNDYNAADAGDIAGLSTVPPNRGFPFTKVPSTGPVGAMTHRKQGVWSLLKPSPTLAVPSTMQHEWDVDNNNDGVTDSIWMDLDLPVLARPSDGKTYLPLIAFMVQDLDALLNVNTVGNLSGDTRNAATTNFGNGADISRSSTGLSTPSEINPLWALDTRPIEAVSLTDHGSYFHAPTTTRHLANMEWWWLNKGRVEFTTPRQIHAGRYGEADRMWGVLSATAGPTIGVQISNSNLFPFPGIWDQDDNRNSNEGGSVSTAGVAGGQTLRFRHPLLLNGMGRYWQDPTAGGNLKQLNLYAGLGGTDPNRWLQYVGVGVGYDGNTTGTGNVAWLNVGPPLTTSLMVNSIAGVNFATPGGSPVLVDDPDEMTTDSKYLQRPYDEPLDAKDILFLFMSPSDRARVGATSRFQDLMPGNITPNTTNFYQLEVARRLTSESWDLKQFAMPRFIGGVGADNKPGVANQDDNKDGVIDDENERGWPGSDDDRAWEYNVDLDGNGKWEFPPQFLGGTGTEQANQPNDPFRPQLRRLLTFEYGNTTNIRDAMRLSINEFLDVEHRPNSTSNPYYDPLAYRPLTPHSTVSTLTTLPAVSPLPVYPPTTEGEKEFWARRDRQQMARDIYVLLYTFCGGNDSQKALNGSDKTGDVTKISGQTIYPKRVGRQMAQFAVNLVDAMDRDNVITAFEYDTNLANGWGLDDDPSTNDAGLPAGERGVVFGVEAPQLTISEVAWYRQKQPVDNTFTPFAEPTGEYNFLQMELRSIYHEDVKLASTSSTSANTGIWRILRDDNNNGVLDAGENAVAFLSGAPSMTPGKILSLASSDGTGTGVASLFVDYTGGGTTTFELVAPNPAAPLPTATFYNATTNPNPTNAADLDLLYGLQSGWYGLSSGAAGDLLSRANSPTTNTDTKKLGSDKTVLRLQRRLNPDLPQLPLAANPYVTVDDWGRDRLGAAVNVMDLALDASINTQAKANTQLANTTLSSTERSQPLDAGNIAASTGAGTIPLKTTLGQENSNVRKNGMGNPEFNLFLPHFDRDFASVIELFDIPLDGPEALTRIMFNSRRPANLVNSAGVGVGQLETGGPFTFGGAVLLQSEDADGNGGLGEDANNNGVLDAGEDLNGNGVLDLSEDLNNNGILDTGEDFIVVNGQLDVEDINNNGRADAHPNHFHRLLSLIEVPTRTHRQLGDPLKNNRVPGRINLNTVRAPHVLAGLIDDHNVIGPPERTGVDIDGDGKIETGLQDLMGDTVEDSTGNPAQRDWWFQFLIARDGLDPTTTLPLPIAGFSRPFHDLGYLRYDQQYGYQSSIEDTILRELPGGVKYSRGKGKGKGKGKGQAGGGNGAAGTADGRRLFELATDAENVNATVDPVMRNRLLAKIIGNTTTRSNVFIVHATIGMFACKEYADGSVRVGGQMDVDGDGSADTHRAIFIVDRSVVEEAYDKGSGTFDWKKLLLAKQRIN